MEIKKGIELEQGLQYDLVQKAQQCTLGALWMQTVHISVPGAASTLDLNGSTVQYGTVWPRRNMAGIQVETLFASSRISSCWMG
jgi:hypothetical protein